MLRGERSAGDDAERGGAEITRAAIHARMSTDKQNEASPADVQNEAHQSEAAPERSLDPRRLAFARALGHLVAELVWRDLTAKPRTEEVKR